MNNESRSRIMQSIRAKNTIPELVVRQLLFSAGFRYRVHSKKVQGKPDILLPKYGAIVEVNGCFWHGHNCHIFKEPKAEKWKQKIEANRERDKNKYIRYGKLGWKVLRVWECAIVGKTRLPRNELVSVLGNWIRFDNLDAELTGRKLNEY